MSRAEAPRSLSTPMAFSRGEFVRGAIRAWVCFLCVDLLVWLFVYFPFGVIYAGIAAPPASGIALVVFATPAWLLGHALRRIPQPALHHASFGAFGVAVGLTSTHVFAMVLSGSTAVDASAIWPLYLVNAAAASIAVVVGWRHGARAVLRERRGLPAVERLDPDAAQEDAITDRWDTDLRG